MHRRYITRAWHTVRTQPQVGKNKGVLTLVFLSPLLERDGQNSIHLHCTQSIQQFLAYDIGLCGYLY